MVKARFFFIICVLTLSLHLITVRSFCQFTKLLDFTGPNGFTPFGDLVSDGTFLYGMTWQGGANNRGVIFKILPDGSGYVKLLDFDDSNGAYPQGSLFYDGTFLYGMATKGGLNNLGNIFKILPDGSGFVNLMDFSGSADGEFPFGSLISDGTFLYGMTNTGGLHDAGTIFKIRPDGTGFAKLLDFGGSNDGFAPNEDLFFDGTFLYGTTSEGGINNLGIIFRILPDGTGFTKLLDFDGIANGATPLGSLISDGIFLYGMTNRGGLVDEGTIFKILPDGTGVLKVLDFGGPKGGNPWGSLVANGSFLYGMTNEGGTSNKGTVFRVKPDGTGFTSLMNFSGGFSNGEIPYGSLISDGTFLYGMTHSGGSNGAGIVFKYSLAISSCVPAAERNALEALFNSTNGIGWTNNLNWFAIDESTWFGVSVNGCTIDEINLENNNLSGSLPTEIGDLPNLMHLFLKDNNLTGPLPVELSNLSNMDFLDLASNNITGTIPQEFGSLNNLFYLDFSGNQLSGSIPVEFGNLSSLGYLELDQNQLTGTIPSELGNISTLLSIDLGKNILTGSIPPSLGNLSNLAFIDFESNQLTGPIPTELGNTSLAFLRLNHNQLTGTIPVSLENLTDLFLLEIIENQLTGSIPEELGNLPLLQYLKLNENQLTGSIPPELGNLGALEYLELYSNQLTGIIPPELGNAASLRLLVLGGNQLTGSIPISLGNIIGLFHLDLSENQLTGSIPPELGNNISLLYLVLHVNQLTGPIPTTLGNLTSLETLNIFTNQLSGTLPVELALCTQLKHLEVADNLLTGTLPIAYQSLVNLEIFQANGNSFTGPVPVEYLAWTNIKELYFTNNQLDALPTFPPGLITQFDVENNLFEFGDLESNMGITGYVYSPQGKLPPGGTQSINENSPISIPFSTSGTSNSYQWFKDGSSVAGATAATFTKTSSIPADAGTYYVEVTSSIVTGLILQSEDYVISINAAPVILTTLITLPIQGKTTLDLIPLITTSGSPLDINSLEVAIAPSSGALASIDANGILTLDYAGINFLGTETLSILACDMTSNCTTQQFEVEVVGDIEVFNAFSPNGDNVNEKFIIQYIDIIPDTQNNHVTIYNRWGDVVFEIDNYDNDTRVFRGLNKNDKELPSSTYFYKIEFTSGRETKTGYLSLKR